MDERTEKMREVSIEMLKLQEMRGLQPPWNAKPYRPKQKEKQKQTKYGWLYIFSGTKRDVTVFIVLMLVLPIITYFFAFLMTGDPSPVPGFYVVVDVIVALLWYKEALETKKYLNEPDDKEQEAIVRQKIAELKELDERLRREELLKKQEETAESESQDDQE